MAVYRCRLIPLTPIHVGASETIALEDYFLANGKLTRFHPPSVVRAMSEAERKRLLALLGGGDVNMPDALKLLRQWAQKTPASWIYSIDVGPASRQALSEAVEMVDTRRGEVHPLIWNEVKREAVLPGSAIKGAIRTALLSSIVASTVQKNAAWKADWEERLKNVQDGKAMAYLAKQLEQQLLCQNHEDTEWDPFRFLKVSDVAIAPQFVRLDRAVVLGPGGSDAPAKIQLHFERIRSASDEGEAPQLEFRLVLEKQEKAWREEVRPYLQKVPSADSLIQSLRFHYINRAAAEARRFPVLYAGNWSRWIEQAKQQGWALIRLGRFSHFESLSVQGLRRTLDRRKQWITEGTSRTYCTPDGTKKMPFGWALLHIAGAG